MRNIDWSAIPFDDLPPWHLDWDVDQRESATNPATTGVTDERPVNSKRYHAADLINHIKVNGGTFTGSKEDLAKAVWPVKTPSGRTILRLLADFEKQGDILVINHGRGGVEINLTRPDSIAPEQMHSQKLSPAERVISLLNGI